MYWTDELSNNEYHNDKAVSTSNIKDFIKDPALLVWSKNAPQDKSKMKAIDFGTDFHSYFLEPEVFKESYKVLPVFNRKKKEEKEAELKLIEEWKEKNIIAVTSEDMIKLEAMRVSAMSHPTVDYIMNMNNSVSERSFFWEDSDTGINCKCRPDRLVVDINDDNRPDFMDKDSHTLVIDVKTIANIDLIQKQSELLKYYVQDAFYSDGVSKVLDDNATFVFIYVSTTMSLGRYPVYVVELDEVAKFDGREEYKKALNDMLNMGKIGNDKWNTVVKIDRPSWAIRDEEDIF